MVNLLEACAVAARTVSGEKAIQRATKDNVRNIGGTPIKMGLLCFERAKGLHSSPSLTGVRPAVTKVSERTGETMGSFALNPMGLIGRVGPISPIGSRG